MPKIEALSTSAIATRLGTLRQRVCRTSESDSLVTGAEYFGFIETLVDLGYFSHAEGIQAIEEFLDTEMYNDIQGCVKSQSEVYSKISDLPGVTNGIVSCPADVPVTRIESRIGKCIKIANNVFMVYDKANKRWNKLSLRKIRLHKDSCGYIYYVNGYSSVTPESLSNTIDDARNSAIFYGAPL